MNLECQLRSIVSHSPVRASLPVAGTDPTQGPNSGPVGREGFPVAGSRAKSLRPGRADVALGFSAPSDIAWELRRIEGRPDSVSRGRISEMPEGSGTATETIGQAGIEFITARPPLGLNKRDRPFRLAIAPTSEAQVKADATARRKGLASGLGKIIKKTTLPPLANRNP